MRRQKNGINIIGRLHEESGTSIAARAVVEVLQRNHIPLAYLALPDQPLARHGQASPLKSDITHLSSMPYQATLLLDLPFIVNSFV